MDEPNVNEPKKQHWLLHYISTHPAAIVFYFIAGLASILGCVLVFFPWAFAAKRELTFSVNPNRTPIVQAAKSSDIAITYKGIKVEGDVTAEQIAIWNNGRESIRREAILTNIILYVPTNCQLLEVKVLQTRQAVSGFQLNTTNMAFGNIGLDWRILQKWEGALVQIVYAGTRTNAIAIAGVIEGQDDILQRNVPPKFLNLGLLDLLVEVLFWIIGVFATVVMVAGILFRKASDKRRKLMDTLMSCVAYMLIIIALIALGRCVHIRVDTTPFGF